MRSAQELNIAGLKCLVIKGKDKGPCVVLFHGYGADFSDLVPLTDYMGLSHDVTWVFPNAPMEIIIAPGFYGRAWFQIDNKRLEQALATGQPVDMSDKTPSGIEGARKLATNLYEELRKQHSKVVLGGFSQGAMLATEVTLTASQKPDGLVIMSGTLISKSRWLELASSCAKVPFVQTHGKNDAILGFTYAVDLNELLSDAGLAGDFYEFNGGHEIPPKAIERIAKFLRALVG